MVHRLTDLPTEVVAHILKLLPKHDLKSARLSSTRLSAIGASMLFDRVYFAPRKLDMESFSNIAQHPVFSQNIKELVYDGRLYREENQEREAYKEMIYWQHYAGQDANQGSLEWCLDPLDLEHYSSCVDEQEYILDKKKDYYALLAGLGQMPIRRLTVQDEFRGSWSRVSIHNTEYPWYEKICSLSFYSIHDEMCDPQSPKFSPSSWNEFRRWLPWASHLPKNRTWDCRGLAHLFAAVSERCHNIHELHIGTENSMTPMILFHPSNGIVNHIDRLAPRLTCLKLASKLYETDARDDIDVVVSRLATLMQQAKQLRTLSLSMNTNEQQSSRIFHGWGTWPHLSLLDLGHFSASQDDLAAAILSQKDSLTELAIRCIDIDARGLWTRLGDEIGQGLRLHKVTIDDLSFDASIDLTDPDAFYSGLAEDVQESVARRIMQWVSPEMLEVRRGVEGYFRSLVASVKSGARDVHAV